MDNSYGDTHRFVRVMVCTRELFVHYPENMTPEEARRYAAEVAVSQDDGPLWSVPKCNLVTITPDGQAERMNRYCVAKPAKT